nr:immunoglobulin heavy chain junction region [Macaca mulatta]MOW79495.1 immunoglobulin heavy chain junction region [Macaca mulatta]MOW81466.1 immunoglobulin heavy chain junction region [Macaca mulatta]MOW82729.1 immunoglobulin heavy chain junction region [Macaca mulatta]MOW83783.1 immunoglobulin heavy chain junction region [Macaca mulatta]
CIRARGGLIPYFDQW